MELPLEIVRVSPNSDCPENTNKYIKYEITNTSRFPIDNVDVNANTIKEDGTNTKPNFCKKITGIKSRILPNESFVITATIKTPSGFSESISINGGQYLSAIDLNFIVTGTLYISKVEVQ